MSASAPAILQREHVVSIMNAGLKSILSPPYLYHALRHRLRAMDPVLDALEDAVVALRYRRGDVQTSCWSGLTITESRHDPYTRQIVFGRMNRFVVQGALFHELIEGPSPVILDVGANIGLMTLMLSRIPGSTVYAFEPGSVAFNCLTRNVEQNRLANIIPVHSGLSDTEGERFIGPPSGQQHPRYRRYNNLKTGLFSVHAAAQTPEARRYGETASFTTLDAFCARHRINTLDFVKIDVEGHEPDVLRGGASMLMKTRPICQVEFNTMTASLSERDAAESLELLRGLRYGVFVYDGREFVETSAPQLLKGRSWAIVDVYGVPQERRNLLAKESLRNVWARVRTETSLVLAESGVTA